MIDEADAGHVSQFTERRCTNPAHAEDKDEEQAGYVAHIARHQFLRKYQDRRSQDNAPIMTTRMPIRATEYRKTNRYNCAYKWNLSIR